MPNLIAGRWEKNYPDEKTPPYPTRYNDPDDLTEYSFTPYLCRYRDGWYDLAEDTPAQIRQEYDEYYAR
ncbi:MAG: hypothetical protein K5931_09280 [Lachnospiraceae bacterium]|nr:hypothetical protein [Lachnospiraceae bacterium]